MSTIYARKSLERARRFRASRINGQHMPFILFMVLTCTPGFTNIGSVNISIALFPIVFVGYAKAALRNYATLSPGARSSVNAIGALILCMCGWDLVTAVNSDSFLRTFRPIYAHASGVAIIIAMLALSRSVDDGLLVRRISSVLTAICLAATYFIGPRGYGDRDPGFFKHPNQLGIISTMAAIYFFCVLLNSTSRKKFFPAIGVVVSIFAMMLSGSKTNILIFGGLALGAPWLLATLKNNMAEAVSVAARNTVAAIALIALAVLALAATNERAYSVLDQLIFGSSNVETYHSVEARDELWEESIEKFKENPLTGVGAGQLLSDGTEHSHNIFMDTIRTTGAPGLFFVTAFVVAIIWFTYGAYQTSRMFKNSDKIRIRSDSARGEIIGSLMALYAYLLANQMSDSFGPTTMPFFYMFLAFSIVLLLPHGGRSKSIA